MDKIIGDFHLINYDCLNDGHRKFKRELMNDFDFKKYFGEFFIKKIDEIFDNADDLEVNKAYLLTENNDIIGMIRIFSYHEAGFINLQYAVRPCYRNKKYGTKILKEISKYFFEQGINVIDLDIDKTNIGSIKCATNIGYEKQEDKYRLRR